MFETVDGAVERPEETPDAELKGDTGSQLEDLIVHVLACEAMADLDDRIDLANRIDFAKGRARWRPIPRGPGPEDPPAAA